MKTKTPVWDITRARESLEMTLRDNAVELSLFLVERVGLRKSQITAENSFDVLTKIQGIKNSNRGYVVIPSPEHRGDGNTSHQARNLASEITATNQNLQKIRDLVPNYFYINNEVGNHKAGHWDLYRNENAQKIDTSANDLACGCYTILQILKDEPAIAPKLNEVLEKLSTEEANKITELLAQDSKVINEFQETALLRKFVRSAMLNSDPLSDDKVLASGYQIEMEELEKALNGLGIQYLMTLDIKKVAEPLSTQEIKEYEEIIIERFTRNNSDEVKRDTMENLSNYLKTSGKSEYDISSILTQVGAIKFVHFQQGADIDDSTANPSANLFQSPQKGILAQPSSSKLVGVFELNAALDDSSDEESSSKVDTFNSATNWRSFKKEKKSFIDGLTRQGLSEEDVKNSFLLHAAGIKAIYGSTADSYYRTKKQSSFDQVDLAPQITAAVDVSVKKIVKSICAVCYRFDQVGDQEEKVTEEIGNSVLVKSQAAIEEFSKLLRDHRVIGGRLWALDRVTIPGNIKKLSEEVSKNFFDVIAEKKLSFKAPIDVSHWHYRAELGSRLGKAACDAARTGLQETTSPDEKSYLLSKNGYSPEAKLRRKFYNLVFNEAEFPSTITAGWNLVRDTESRAPVNFDVNVKEITRAFLQDLVNLDKKDKTKSHSSEVWKKALEHEEIIKLLPLTPQRAQSKVSRDFSVKLNPSLKEQIDKIRFVRPTLPEMHELTSSSIAEFLANLHLANKSQTRTIRNFEDEKNNNGEIFYRSWKLSDSAQSKPALERQEITTNRVRSDFVDNAGTNTSNYDTIHRDLRQLQRKLNVNDATIGRWIKEVIDGTPIEALQNNQNQPVNFSSADKKILINTVYLILGTETARNPASLTANMMLMDLVETSQSKTALKEAFSKDEFEDRYGGGEAPMSIGKMMVTSTSQKGSSGKKPSSKDSQTGEEKKELGEPVQSARRLHQEFGSFMPFAYKYEGDAHGDGDKDAKRTAELVRRESEVVKRWIAQKDISSDFFEESMLIAYQDWHITNSKKDKRQNIVQSALNAWLAGMETEPTKEFKMGDYRILTNLLERFEFKPDQDQYDEIGHAIHNRLNHLKANDCPPEYAEKIFIKTLAKQEMFDCELLDSKEDVGSKGSNTGKYGSLITWVIESTIDQENIDEVFAKEAVMVEWKEWAGFDPLPYPNDSKEHPTLIALEKWLSKIEENKEEMNRSGIGEENYELLAKVIELCPYAPSKKMPEKLSKAIYSRLHEAGVNQESIGEQEERFYRNLARSQMFNFDYLGDDYDNLISWVISNKLTSVAEIMIPKISTEFLSTDLIDGITAMSLAADNNDEKICRLLIDHQVPVDERTKESDFYKGNEEIFHPKTVEKQKLVTPSNSSSPLSHSKLSSKSTVNSRNEGV